MNSPAYDSDGRYIPTFWGSWEAWMYVILDDQNQELRKHSLQAALELCRPLTLPG